MQNDRTAWAAYDDRELVERALDGDNAAFSQLIDRHLTTCQKLALSILRNPTDAEDEVQNACWKAFEHLAQFQHDAKFSTWLTRIVVNQCLMKLRQMRRARLVYIDDPVAEDAAPMEIADRSTSPEDAVGKVEVSKVVQQEISRIPPLLRNVFVLRDVQQLPIEQVAESLGITVAAAKSRLLRARMELRNRMTRHCGRTGPAALLA